MTKSSYFCLLRLRTYEGVDLLYKREILTRLQYLKLKLEGKFLRWKVLSVPCCWSWLTPALLFFTSLIHTIINYVSIYTCFHFYTFHILFFSWIFITSPYSILIFLCPGHFVRVVCTQGLPSTLFWRKKLFSSHTVLYLCILVTS